MNNKVLVVDDNPQNIRLLKEILEDEQFIVITAEESSDVDFIVKHTKPDVILLDIMMPVMDGFEVCQRLKTDNDIKDIPVIMVTAKTEANDVKKALETGAFDYIKKPIDEIEVVARVQSALRYKYQLDRFKELATKDGLTSIYNHALVIELFEKELFKQTQTHQTLSFVMLDIDYFKKINDTYGHTSGDIVLKELAAILISSVDSNAIVGRYGGEEFCLVLPDSNCDNAGRICEQLRLAVEDHTFYADSHIIKITISIGIYNKLPDDNTDLHSVIQNADQALYKAKQNGRNRIETYQVC